MMYAIKRGRRTVAHLCNGPFQPPLCGRHANLTSNMPGGKRTCRDCLARAVGSSPKGEGDDRGN